MQNKYTGGCACGEVRYEIKLQSVFENHCQCLHCQKFSGTGHGSYLSFIGQEHVKVTGNAKGWRIAGDSGKDKIHSFCPVCGTPVFQTYPDRPEVFTIHAASLDDPGQFKPEVVTYHGSAYSWDYVDADLEFFDRNP